MFNEVIVIGRLASEPIIRETQQGVKLATLILEVERPYRNNLGIVESDYISCVAWRGLSNTIIDCCEIGSFLGIKGRMQSKSFQNTENQTISTLEVKIEHLELLDRFKVEK